MTFSFAFQFDEADLDHETSAEKVSDDVEVVSHSVVRLPPKVHSLEELIDNLPSAISFTTIKVHRNSADTLHVRELFDARFQTAQSDLDHIDHSEDLRDGVYEGGFKTWECSLDLCSVLPKWTSGTCVEIGCGTALPSLCILKDALECNDGNTETNLILQDYNLEVLNLMTVPNLFLTWYFSRQNAEALDDEELDVTPALKAQFIEDMHKFNINLSFFSGSWKNLRPLLPDNIDLVYTSETIYNIQSLPDLMPLLIGKKVLVAAKVLYFGVGGGIPSLKLELAKSNLAAESIWKGGLNGVSREILQIQ